MRWSFLLAVLPLSLFALAFQTKPAPAPAKPTFEKSVLPFLKTYCVTCHAGPYAPDGIDYSVIKTKADATKGLKNLQKGVKYMKAKKMPPKTAKQPKPAEAKAFSDWVAKGKD